MEIANKIDLPALYVEARAVVVVWFSEAGSGEASTHHSWCIETRVNGEPWRYAADHEPGDRADRSGSWPKVQRYPVEPFGGRYRSHGIRDVPGWIASWILSTTRGIANPHIHGYRIALPEEGNHLDVDLPPQVAEALGRVHAAEVARVLADRRQALLYHLAAIDRTGN
jgi:hypothetical protein